MKVNRTVPSKVLKIYGENKKVLKNKNVSDLKKKDSIQISSVGKNLSAYSISDKDLENREEKIQKLKKAIDNGTYKVDSKCIAKKMIEDMKRSR